METQKRVTLLELANHLEKGKRLHKKFNFAVYSQVINNSTAEKNCGTSGCAIGEMPVLDSRWKFNKNDILLFNDLIVGCLLIADYFGIKEEEANHLFYANLQKECYCGKFLNFNATKKDVIHNIRAFVRITGKN